MVASDDFAALWEANYQRVYSGLRKCGANQADAEDALAEAGLRAWTALERFDPSRASFRTWFGVIAFREWLRIIHKAKRYIPLNEEATYAAVFVEFEESDPDELTLAELAGILTDTIHGRECAIADKSQQPTETYAMITQELVRRARAGERLRQRDIARALGIQPSAVCRCLAYLRQELPGLKPP